eukprot:7287483-Alexandrium_andersonii.AAC.1
MEDGAPLARLRQAAIGSFGAVNVSRAQIGDCQSRSHVVITRVLHNRTLQRSEELRRVPKSAGELRRAQEGS